MTQAGGVGWLGVDDAGGGCIRGLVRQRRGGGSSGAASPLSSWRALLLARAQPPHPRPSGKRPSSRQAWVRGGLVGGCCERARAVRSGEMGGRAVFGQQLGWLGCSGGPGGQGWWEPVGAGDWHFLTGSSSRACAWGSELPLTQHAGGERLPAPDAIG